MQEECPMSEQQSQTVTAVQATRVSACPHPEAVGKRWGDPISEERQKALQGYVDLWQLRLEGGELRGRGPFDRNSFMDADRERFRLTGADVFWLAGQYVPTEAKDLTVAVPE